MSDYTQESEDPVDRDLEYVRGKRMAVIDTITSGGIPSDTEKLSLLLGALNDMDRTSIGKKRIKVESSAVEVNKRAADLIAALYTRPDSKVIGTNSNNEDTGKIPSTDTMLPAVELLEGEMSVGSAQLDYESFMKR
jgi:hypothetical protein